MSIFNTKNKRTNIVIDWLQVYCMGIFKKPQMYEYESLNYGNKTFKNICNIYLKGKLVGSLAFNPRNDVMPEFGALLKIQNNMLYCSNPILLCHNILLDFGYEFKSISRLDLACDFNRFNNNLDPERFIKNYLTNKYTKLKRNDFKVDFKDNSEIIVKAIEKYYKNTIARQNDKLDRCTLHGRQRERITYETLRFGNNISAVSCYLYNKTSEMSAKKHKEYIVENWKTNELDVTQDVWRIEISIKGNKWKVIDLETSEIRGLQLNDLLNQKQIEQIYWAHFDKYFDFRYNKPHTKRTRLKRINLLDHEKEHVRFIMSMACSDSTRMDKIFIRMLEAYNCELRESKRCYKNDLTLITKDYAYDKGLTNFYYNKVQLKEDIIVDKRMIEAKDIIIHDKKRVG